MSPHYIIALEAAIEAGKAVKLIYLSKDFGIEIKADDSPVTKADKKSSAIIAEFLQKTSFPVIDEEHGCPDYSIRKQWENLWLVDPMDGTKEFISGNGEFTVNIALIKGKKPVFGVIYAPVTGDLYWGGKETGSFKVENIVSWPGVAAIESMAKALRPDERYAGAMRVAASRSHLDAGTRGFIANLKKNFEDIEFVSKGSSLKLCMLAEGNTDVYPRFSRTMEWDTAAGHAIASGTSGVLLQVNGLAELEYNKEDLSNPSFLALSGPQVRKGFDFKLL